MNILTVGSSADALAALRGILERLFPDAQIVPMTDPLMAGKYAFHNRVDLLLAEAEMKRMDGLQLIRFVRQEQPGVRAYLLGREKVLRALTAGLPGAVGRIPYPLRAEEAAAILRGETRGEEQKQTGHGAGKEGQRL